MKQIIKIINSIIYIPFIFSIIGTVAIVVFIFFYSKNTELDKMTNQEITDYFYKLNFRT